MVEVWKNIVYKGIDYKGKYKVSSLGRIKNVETDYILKPLNNLQGYLYINLRLNGKLKQCLIHRLVATMFLDNPENKPQVNHIDHNRQNNKLSNLEWTTASENIKAMYKNLKVNKHNKKFRQYDLDGEFLYEYKSLKDAVATVGISKAMISSCCSGKYKTAGGFLWERIENHTYKIKMKVNIQL